MSLYIWIRIWNYKWKKIQKSKKKERWRQISRQVHPESCKTSSKNHDLGKCLCKRVWEHLLPVTKFKLNSSIYHDVIKDYLLPTMSKYRCLLFLQDNASPHTSKQTSSYLKQNNIQTLYLPASSPDLNVIENTFNFLKYQLESEDTSTLPNLKKAIKKCVGKLKRSYFENLCLSMPTRLREVIKRKGDMTHY